MRETDFARLCQYLRDLQIGPETYLEVGITFRAGELKLARASYTDVFDLDQREEPKHVRDQRASGRLR